jgi:hypothetical protein
VQSPFFSQSFNRYSYALNNPLKYTDKNGEFWQYIVAAAFLYIMNAYNQRESTIDENGQVHRNNHISAWAWNPLDWSYFEVGIKANSNGDISGSIAAGDSNGPMPAIGYSNKQGFGIGYSQNGNTNLYHPSYNYNAPEQAAARDYENARQSVTPWNVGWEWLTGTGPRSRTFYGGDYFTELLRQHGHINDTRNMMINDFRNGNFSSGERNYGLNGWDGIGKYIGDYSTLATGGMTGNLAVTYLGSYDLKYEVLSTNKNPALVQFTVTNTSHAASAVRPPVVGYWPVWQNHIGPFINSLFNRGPMSPTKQTFIWNETIYW